MVTFTMNVETPYMAQALAQAGAAARCGEVPVGAVVVDSATGVVIAGAHNLTEARNDPTAHAELLALRTACRIKESPRLPECDLYVTLEPCAMCATAISFARIRRLYFGAYDIKGGSVEHGARIFAQPTCHHAPEVIGGVMESTCGDVLKRFFENKRRA